MFGVLPLTWNDHISASHFHANSSNSLRGEYWLQLLSWDHRTLIAYTHACSDTIVNQHHYWWRCRHIHTHTYTCKHVLWGSLVSIWGNFKDYSSLPQIISIEFEFLWISNFSSFSSTVYITKTLRNKIISLYSLLSSNLGYHLSEIIIEEQK